MITGHTAITIHNLLIDEFGGSDGVRDCSLLESALARPFQTFDGIDLYPTAYLNAAAILESILINYPFIDRNKRTAFLLMNIILEQSSIRLTASQDELYELIIHIISERPSIETVAMWLEQKSSTYE
jgi:death on curing protein